MERVERSAKNRQSWWIGITAAITMVLGVPSCSASLDQAGDTTCTPGQQSVCACSGGGSGIQTCQQDGKGVGPCLNCEVVAAGGDAGADAQDAGVPEATASYCVEHCDDSRCQALVTCVGESPAGWTGPVALSLTPGTSPPCDSTFETKLFEGGDTPKADPATCGTIVCGPPNAPPAPQVCFTGATTSATTPPPTWTTKALGCRAQPPSNGNCGVGKVCSPRPSTVFRQSLCIANLSGDVPCPTGPFSERHIFGQSISDTRSCDQPSCGPAPTCMSNPNPPKGSLSAASLVTVCCAS